MYYVRKANDRGRANFGWLDSRHSFSFGSYYDPKHMGFSALQVINDDWVAGGAGFDTHGHRDMEIISYVLAGAIKHQDSMGNRFTVPAGQIQRMSAGSGISHSEYNGSQTAELRFLQIWIQPNVRGIKPSYEQSEIPQRGILTPLVTSDGRDGSLRLHQDASISRVQLDAGQSADVQLGKRSGYLHLLGGGAEVGHVTLGKSDGLGVTAQQRVQIRASSEGVEALWFDLPAIR